MAITKEAAAQAYEAGVALAMEDSGLTKTAADPGKLQALWAALQGAGSKAKGMGEQALGGLRSGGESAMSGLQAAGGKAKEMAMAHPGVAGGTVGAGGTAAMGGDIEEILAGMGVGAAGGAGLSALPGLLRGGQGVLSGGRMAKGLESLMPPRSGGRMLG